jgi:hypothetical protein
MIPISILQNSKFNRNLNPWPSLIMLILLITVGIICWICK